MGQVRGYRRSGHYRKGKWVRPHHVRSHYRDTGPGVSAQVSDFLDRVFGAGQSTPPIPRPRPQPPPPRKRHDNLSHREQERVEAAVDFAFDMGAKGWEDAVAGRISDFLTPMTFDRLFHRRRARDCKFLADLAKDLLEGKKKLHEVVGGVAGWAASRLGAGPIQRIVARELVERIPIPFVDQPVAFVARGLQMCGIVLCLSRDIPPDRCQSFIDLALAESKERVKEILTAAMKDWARETDDMVTAWARKARP
jgi:hypothetical protein